MNKVLLSVNNLDVEFCTYAGKVHAVRGLSFEVFQGEIFGLVGETGCGKSVTALSIIGLVPEPGVVSADRIEFNGIDLLSLSRREMRQVRGRRIALTLQDPSASLNPVFSIGHLITRIIRHHDGIPYDEARLKAKEALVSVGLPSPDEIMKCYPHELSGGMQQRVIIAMGLCTGAELLIADEPTTALDVTIQAQIMHLLLKLKESHGLSILLITHNLGIVAESCDRVGVLYAGTMVELGNTVDVFGNMVHPYTKGLLAAVLSPESHGRPLVELPGSVPSGLELTPGCPFHPRCPYVVDICKERKPSLVPLGNSHYARCFLVDGVT